MKKQQNIFLVGPMGAGKTTVGRYLAKILHREFYDSDQVVELRTGVDIAWIFDVEGEAGFRLREQTVIDELTQKAGVILATGGGAVLNQENRKYLASRGIVVYLQATVEQQMERTEKDKRRPLLQTGNRQERLEDIIKSRDSLYREVSDHAFDTNQRSVRAVANDILKVLYEEK